MRGDISSQIREVMEVDKDLKRYGVRREDAYDRKKWRERIRSKFANPGQPG